MRDRLEPYVWEPTTTAPGHCQKCGRFVPNATLAGGGGPDLTGDYPDETGICAVHGRQVVVWGPP